MFSLVIFAPLISFFSGIFFAKYLGKNGVSIITISFTLFTFFLSVSTFYMILICKCSILLITLANWINVDNFSVDFCFYFDSLTVIMLCVVTSISTFVHLYSSNYMLNDPHITRFMSYLSLFTFFMLILVTANNFLQMFVGWEGVGVSSYLLINFWYTRIQANKAAIKAMLINRIGDFALLLAMFSIYCNFNSLNYDSIFALIPCTTSNQMLLGIFKIPAIDMISILLFLGAMGKSAQLGFHTWLPDAMEGPTPVSALIHAATMVTAGVFLLVRCSYIIEFSVTALFFITIIGACTAFFAATTGLFQNDIKRIIAYSTCSQLGYMVFACGLSSYEVGIFHLSNHAFFKALLFLGAGSIIHALADEQDLRKMGGLKQLLPFSYAIMLIGSLALIGFPFLAGFYSKDVILELSFISYSLTGHFSFILGTLAAFCTAFYSMRILFLVFLSPANGNKNIIFNAHEGSWQLTLPLLSLSFFSIFIGYLTKDLIIGFGTDFWNSAIWVFPNNYKLTDIEFIPTTWKILPLLFTIIGVVFAYILYSMYVLKYFKIKMFTCYKWFYNFFNKKWFIDRLYTEFLVQNCLITSFNYFYKEIDRGVLEKIGPTGLIKFWLNCIQLIKPYQSGQVLMYLSFTVLNITALFIFIFL
jgi:NADH-ubiquinone oxidoreductase chain 5